MKLACLFFASTAALRVPAPRLAPQKAPSPALLSPSPPRGVALNKGRIATAAAIGVLALASPAPASASHLGDVVAAKLRSSGFSDARGRRCQKRDAFAATVAGRRDRSRHTFGRIGAIFGRTEREPSRRIGRAPSRPNRSRLAVMDERPFAQIGGTRALSPNRTVSPKSHGQEPSR